MNNSNLVRPVVEGGEADLLLLVPVFVALLLVVLLLVGSGRRGGGGSTLGCWKHIMPVRTSLAFRCGRLEYCWYWRDTDVRARVLPRCGPRL
jgi:hypothetical protein